jgi:hypothetical protein
MYHLPPDVQWGSEFIGSGAISGFICGAIMGGRERSRQYLAENAHHLPKTKSGWYHYHRRKQMEVMRIGTQKGIRYGIIFSGIFGAFAASTIALERMRGKVEFWQPILGGGVTASLFSLVGKFKIVNLTDIARLPPVAQRTALAMGLVFGSCVACAEKAHYYITGQPLRYLNTE